MCGITGFIGEGTKKDLDDMVKILAHRGPDEEGVYIDDKRKIYLGHRRLSIIDLDGGKQPMWSEDRSICIVFNGEIYNNKELRQKLEKKGYKFESSHSDTETLIYAYMEWGSAMANKLNGMWAFAIYDTKQNLLFCSRDRFGKKPFFYYHSGNLFAFSSELTSLTKHRMIPTKISTLSLQKFFAYGYIPSPRSVYEGISKLPGGYNMILDIPSSDLKISKYWDFVIEPFSNIPKNPEEEWGEQLRDLLSQAVKRRLVSDVPLGIFLSGGIDSSSIAYYAVKHTETGKVKTFNIGFYEADFDESRYATEVAQMLDTDHYSKIFSLEEASMLIPDVLSRLDEPMGDSSLIPSYQLSSLCSKHVKVALSGDGGDEIFAGYDPFKALHFAKVYQTLVPKKLHQGILMVAGKFPVSSKNMSLDFKIKRFLRGLDFKDNTWNPVWLSPLLTPEINELFSQPVSTEELYSEAIEEWDSCKQTNPVDRTLQFYTSLYLHNGILVKADRASMMNSLEVRSPFLDIDLVDFARKIPWNYKFRNGTCKYILKKALEPVLPLNIVYRKKKGFGIPISKWFRESVLPLDFTKFENILNVDYCKKLYKDHTKGETDRRLFLWNLMVLSHTVLNREKSNG